MAVPAVENAIAIVDLVARAPGRHGTAELARVLEIPPASCFRIVQTLTESRWVAKDRRGVLRLSVGLLPVVESMRSHAWLASLADEHLRVLVEKSGLTAKLSVREGDDQVTLARAESDQPYALSAPVGSRYPVVLGASGACLLSSLPARQVSEMIDQAPKKAWRIEKPKHLRDMIKQVQQQGSCQNIGIHPQGIETISAPVRSEAEGVVAAVTLVGLRGELESLGLDRTHDLVRQAALACSASLLG